jgi:hypothetical protein
MVEAVEIRWIQTGVVGGLCASVLYPLLIFAPLPPLTTVALAAFLGPAIGIGSLGLRRLFRVHRKSVAASLGAIHNVLAGALFTAMALVQMAVRLRASDASGASARIGEVVGVWLGLDVAWDVYIGLGTLCFAWAMLGHPRFGWPFAAPGFVVGSLVIALNLQTFPAPPAEAGSFDVGPFVGLWYLAVTVQAWRSLGWARERLAGDRV